MNLVTQTLIERLGYHPIAELVRWWDPFEGAVIHVYKTGTVLEEDRVHLLVARDEIDQLYDRWEKSLQPYWQDLYIGGKPVTNDPFRQLLAFDRPESFLDNWAAMQTLPVAREAINRFLWDQTLNEP